MLNQELTTLNYKTRSGKFPFEDWILGLRDRLARATIYARLNRLRNGNFGDCRTVGEGVWELKIHLGPGYRVYFAREGLEIILLLCGGTKRDQSSDIQKAKEYFRDYKERIKNEKTNKKL